MPQTSAIREVLMTADPLGGIWTYALDLADALAPHRVHVTLATMGGPLSAGQRAAAAACSNLALIESTYRLEWMDDPWADVAAAGRWLLGIEDQVRPQVIHLNSYTHAALPWRAPTLVVGHSCVGTWFEYVRRQPPPDPPWGRYAQAVQAGLRAAAGATAPTQAMLADLVRHYGGFRRLGPIYNTRQRGLFRALRKEPLILTVGRLWDEAKNVAAVDRVAAELEWPVAAAGAAAGPDGNTTCLRHLRGLGELGPGELAEWYGRAAVFVLPSRYEPFGLAALEAGLAGCALVLGDIPSLREVWGDAALFVPPDDGRALAEALQRLIADEEYRGALAQRAHTRAALYTPQRMARGYLAAYEAVTGARPAPRRGAAGRGTRMVRS